MKSEEQTRRQFCARACRAASLAALGGAMATALESCGGGSSPTSPGGGEGFNNLPVLNGDVASSTITLSVAGTALGSAGCTHQSCEITGYSGQTFVCPCHGSRFDANGQVVQGPATRALPQFQTQFADDVLTITA